jgi:hypothetical protein
MSSEFDHLRITYMWASYDGRGLSRMSHRVEVVERMRCTWMEQAANYFREGFAIEVSGGNEILIGPAAILSIERCNKRGYAVNPSIHTDEYK